MFVLAKPRTRRSNHPDSSVFDFVEDAENGSYIIFNTLDEAKAYEAEYYPHGTHFIFKLVG